MPKKILFSVVYATDEDPKFRSEELNTHGPTVKGWQSAKNCEYPQVLVLQLEKRCCLNKIQILAHQYLIPSKIELFTSNEDITAAEPENLNWEYLGYITLSDNQSIEFKSRELKSVNVPSRVASYVKLQLSTNHKNANNIKNQVSLIAVNILGTDVEVRRLSNSESSSNSEKVNALLNDTEYYSPYDDLAFEMYVDTEIATIIRDMEYKKHIAVINERFEYARKLKQTMEFLRTAGEKLGKYELEKRHAIEQEDYERAKVKKNQSDDFRTEIYLQVNVEQLLETEGVCAKNDVSSKELEKHTLSPTLIGTPKSKRAASPNTMNIHQNHSSPLHVSRVQSAKNTTGNTGSPTNFQTRGSFRRRNKSAGAIVKSTYEQYEEKPLPALRHSQTNEFLRECHMDYDYKASKLTEREKKQAALSIVVFGNELVEKFYSKHYLDKEEGLNLLKEDLMDYDNSRMHTANKTGRAAIFLLHRALRDKVFSVYSLANEVIRLYFVQFVPGRVSPTEVSRSVDKLLPELLTKSGDTSARIHHMAVHTILTMADCKPVRDLHLIPVHLSRPVNSSTHPRLALSRAEMVEQLIINQGISTDKQSGLTCRTLSEFGSSCLHHPAEAVRKVGERILVLVYKVNPRLVRKQLPPDDDITRRNLLYRQLFHEFDKIDVQRKRELLEKNRLIQQCSVNTNPDCLSPEPVVEEKGGMNGVNKYYSSPHISNMVNNQYSEEETSKPKNYALTKSLSGGHIVQRNESPRPEVSNEQQSTSSASGVSSPSNHSQQDEDEKYCIFCNQAQTIILTNNNSMNSHYWRSCPMLLRCKDCSQVVEVATLTEHLLMECELREEYTQCAQCTEAIKVNDVENHGIQCIELPEGCQRCPLCQRNLDDEENAWKQHLMGDMPCPKNTRVKYTKQVKYKL